MAKSILAVELLLLTVLGVHALAEDASAPSMNKRRIYVSEFHPGSNTILNEREQNYCKMLQRGVEDELASFYEVEESTRFAQLAKAVAECNPEQAARVLGEKTGVHEVVTGLVTKAGNTVMVQCHFVEVARETQETARVSNRITRTINADCKITKDDDWIHLLRILQSNIRNSLIQAECISSLPLSSPSPSSETKIRVKVGKQFGMSVGEHYKETELRELRKEEVLGTRNLCELKSVVFELKIAQALRELDKANYKEAAKILDELVQFAGDNGEVWYIRGVTRYFEKKYNEAAQCFIKAIELGYDHASVRDDLANTYLALSHQEEETNRTKYYKMALEQAEKSLKISPGNPWAYNMIGCVTFMTAGKDKNKLKIAADALKKASELLSSDPQILDNTANALAQIKEFDEAEQYALKALRIVKKNNQSYPGVYETLSKIYSAKGNKEKAREYYQLYIEASGT